MPRTRKSYRLFLKEPQRTSCPFCELPDKRTLVVKKHLFIIKNIYPYDWWDFRKVTAHLMVVPKNHVESLQKLSLAALKEYWEVLIDYESQGYSISTRPQGSIRKSVAHQHTHLIKTGGPLTKFMIFIKKPYWFIFK